MAPEIDIDDIPPEEPIPWLKLVKIAVGILFIVVLAFFLLGRTGVIRPEKPQFTLQDITLYDFNISVNPSLLSSRFQVTVLSCNPNTRIGIYYDSLVGYATYYNQQVTSRTDIPATYQGHRNSDVWSVLISGTSVPLAPYIGAVLSQDWGDQMAAIVIELEGQVRWKLGVLAEGDSHITVRCPAYITARAFFSDDNNAVKYQLFQRCDVDFSK